MLIYTEETERKKKGWQQKGKIPWNKGLSASEETRKKLSLAHMGKPAWNKGLHGVQAIWNKGKTNVYSAEHLERMRLAGVKRKTSDETKRKISETNQNMSPETRAIISAKISAALSGRVVSDATRLKISQSRLRDKHWHWKGDLERNRYPVYWTAMLKNKIRLRDNFTCQFCGKAQGKRLLSVHHIDYHKENCNEDNLVTLCLSCHVKTNYNCEFWINFFTSGRMKTAIALGADA